LRRHPRRRPNRKPTRRRRPRRMRRNARSRSIRRSRSTTRLRRRSVEHGGGPFGRLGRLPLGLAGDLEERVDGHLNRYKRYPSGAASTGTASVAFTIPWSGQVLSVRMIGSSGNPALDAEAVSLPRRASPVPAPPAGFWRRRSNPHCPNPFRRMRRAFRSCRRKYEYWS
jgi:periplasmic protein TonB